mmetsp:Transcript_21401/g.69019  ORF Transcript_21401/g.69019 Transcript_21401/m.69019 type:complete len:279 (+) Transcript_21401:71-907(+)
MVPATSSDGWKPASTAVQCTGTASSGPRDCRRRRISCITSGACSPTAASLVVIVLWENDGFPSVMRKISSSSSSSNAATNAASVLVGPSGRIMRRNMLARSAVTASSGRMPSLKQRTASLAKETTLNMVPGLACSLSTLDRSRATKRMRWMRSCWLVSNTHDMDEEVSTTNTTRLARMVPTSGDRGYGSMSCSTSMACARVCLAQPLSPKSMMTHLRSGSSTMPQRMRSTSTRCDSSRPVIICTTSRAVTPRHSLSAISKNLGNSSDGTCRTRRKSWS